MGRYICTTVEDHKISVTFFFISRPKIVTVQHTPCEGKSQWERLLPSFSGKIAGRASYGLDLILTATMRTIMNRNKCHIYSKLLYLLILCLYQNVIKQMITIQTIRGIIFMFFKVGILSDPSFTYCKVNAKCS